MPPPRYPRHAPGRAARPRSLDHLFKELLQRQIAPFIASIFPRYYRVIRWDRIEFLNPELISIGAKGELRIADIVVRVYLEDQENYCDLIINLEFEANSLAEMDPRVYTYNMRLDVREEAPTLPIVIQIGGRPRKRAITLRRWRRPSPVRGGGIVEYWAVCLPSLVADDLLTREQAINGILALSARPPEGVPETAFLARCLHKCLTGTMTSPENALYFLQMANALHPLDPGGIREYIDTVRAAVTDKEEIMVLKTMRTFSEELYDTKEELRAAREQLQQQEERTSQQEEEVRRQDKQDALWRVLARRFPDAPAAMHEHVLAINDLTVLDRCFDLALDIGALADMRWE